MRRASFSRSSPASLLLAVTPAGPAALGRGGVHGRVKVRARGEDEAGALSSGALGTAQILAWGSSYYLPAILADPIADGLGLSRRVFGVFSGSLLLSAVLGPPVGRAIDNRGGRGVLALSNLVLAAGLVLLALAQGIVGLVAAWTVLGVGMALGPLRFGVRHALPGFMAGRRAGRSRGSL